VPFVALQKLFAWLWPYRLAECVRIEEILHHFTAREREPSRVSSNTPWRSRDSRS
jgi:hypothetical protein